MLAANIETEVREILKKKGKKGWLRVQECANEYAKEPITKKIDNSKKTKFYRWRRQVEKGKVEGFQVLKLIGNVSFIGLKSADPSIIGLEGLVIAKVSMDHGVVVIEEDTSLTIILSLRNKLKTSTTVEEVQIETDGKQIVREMQEDIPPGRTRRIEVPCLATQLGRTWKEGGKCELKIVHTYGTQSLSFEVPPLFGKFADIDKLPFSLFTEV